MNSKGLLALWVCLSVCVTTGCVRTVDGRHRAGVPFIRDEIESRYERSPTQIWQAAKEVLAYNGTITSEDLVRSTLQASVNDRTVWVRVEPIDVKISRVIVQVRTKGGTSDLDLAAELDKQIAIRLATGNLPSAPVSNTASKP